MSACLLGALFAFDDIGTAESGVVMIKLKGFVLAGFVLFFGWLALVPRYSEAAAITGTYYSVGNELRVVGFDGTGFVGGATTLSPLAPDWTAMSYDAGSGRMYYSVGNELRVVGFDGTGFVGGATTLSPLAPD